MSYKLINPVGSSIAPIRPTPTPPTRKIPDHIEIGFLINEISRQTGPDFGQRYSLVIEDILRQRYPRVDVVRDAKPVLRGRPIKLCSTSTGNAGGWSPAWPSEAAARGRCARLREPRSTWASLRWSICGEQLFMRAAKAMAMGMPDIAFVVLTDNDYHVEDNSRVRAKLEPLVEDRRAAVRVESKPGLTRVLEPPRTNDLLSAFQIKPCSAGQTGTHQFQINSPVVE